MPNNTDDAVAEPNPYLTATLPTEEPNPYLKAALPTKAQLLLQMASAQRTGTLTSGLDTLTDNAEQLVHSFARLPSDLLNQPTRLANLVLGPTPIPDMFGEGKPIVQLPEPSGTTVAAGLGKLAARTVSGLTTPENLLGAPGAAGSAALRTVFGMGMAQELPSQVGTAIDAAENPYMNAASKTVAIGSPVVSAAMIAGLAAHESPASKAAKDEAPAAPLAPQDNWLPATPPETDLSPAPVPDNSSAIPNSSIIGNPPVIPDSSPASPDAQTPATPSEPPPVVPSIESTSQPEAGTAVSPVPVASDDEVNPYLAAAAAPPSRLVQAAFNDLHDQRAPIPASIVQQSGVNPEALAPGYDLNAAGTAYEYTAPEPTLTPEQQQAREAVQAMADLRAQREANPDSALPTVLADGHQGEPVPPEPATVPLVPVKVAPADVTAAMAKVERPPDILDTIKDYFPGGVKFDPADQAEPVKTARGAAAELMSHTRGEPADKVLDGLHREGLFRRIQNESDLAEAMKLAGETRINERNAGSPAARQLAEEAKRAELWSKDSGSKRAGAEPVPARQLFIGETFKVKGNLVRVIGHGEDEHGQPDSVLVDGAYGRQTLAGTDTVHIDKGSSSMHAEPELPFNTGAVGRGLDHDTTAAGVQAFAKQVKGAPEVEVVNRPDWQHNGYGVRGTIRAGKIIINRTHIPDAATLQKVLREEHSHLLLASEAGRTAIRTAASRGLGMKAMAELRQQYPQGRGESAEAWQHRLTDEFAAKAASEHLPAWKELVERVKSWLAQRGIGSLTHEETARAIVRALRQGKTDRTLQSLAKAARYSLENKGKVPMSTEARTVADQFRRDLQRSQLGELSQDKALQLGRTPEALRAAGIPDGKIYMTQRVALEKPIDPEHPYPAFKLMRLPEALNDPILVHESWTEPNAYVVLLDMHHGGKNMVAALHFRKTLNGLEVTEVKSVYPRDASQVLAAIRRTGGPGGVTYWNKEKTRQWLAGSSGFNSPQHLGPLSGQRNLPTNEDLGQGRFSLSDQPETNPPAPATPATPVAPEPDPAQGTRQFAEQLQASDDMSEALKGQVTNTRYTKSPQETDVDFAGRMMRGLGGPGAAREVFRDMGNGLAQPVRIALGMQILKGLDAGGRVDEAARFFDDDFAPHTTDIAQGLAMLNAWHALSKDGKLAWARKKIADAGRDAMDPVKPDIDAAKDKLRAIDAQGIEHATADPAVQRTAQTAITEAVANSDATHKGIVMELTEPWASAKVILDMARAQVHAKANDLLTKQPRPIQFTVAQHLRAIMDDLATRAASIAASHYQGAEPGVTLRAKLMQRLGLSEDAAAKLANGLDKEFARQVTAAKAALPARLARQIERMKQGLPADATETAVDRSIRQQLTEKKQTLGTLVRQHWTKVDATKAALKDKLVKQAGLTGDAAQKLADTISRRLDALTTNAKRKALEQVLKPLNRLKLAKPELVQRLLNLSHLGAFDDKAFYDAVKERMNLPEWTPELQKQLAGLADQLAKIPESQVEEAQRRQIDFMNAIERAKGISNLDLSLAFYMSNILSGVTTHVRVAVHTSAQMVAATTAELSQAMVEGRVHDIPLIFQALAQGFGKAAIQTKDIMRTGMVVGSKLQNIVPLSVLEQIHFGQKGGTTTKQGVITKAILENRAAVLLNLWKYNSRLITAQHMVYFKPAEEMKLALLASRQARSEGLTGQAAVDRARLILGYGAAQVRAAEAQAIREGFEGTKAKMRTGEILGQNMSKQMRDTARDYALRQTFLNDPYGCVGYIANTVASLKNGPPLVATAARVIVPFTRIAANLFNEGVNYTPVGASRAFFAKKELLGQKFADITPEVRSDLQKELYAKAALGTMLITGIALKAATGLNQPNPDFTVYGQGPANPDDKAAWRAAGAIPYSIKIGNRYVSYANTPANVMMATLGNYLDGARDAALYQRPGALRLSQDMPMRTAAAMLGASKVIMEQPFLQSLMDVASMSSEPNPELGARKAIKVAARTASSFVVPNLVRQLDRFYDPTLYQQNDVSGILTSQVPFLRQTGKPMLNALGQPIQSPVFGQFASSRTASPLIEMLADHNAWPTLPNQNQTLVNGVPLTDDQFYKYVQTRGTALTEYLSKPGVATILTHLDAQGANLKAHAAVNPNPVAAAKQNALAASLPKLLLDRYEGAANKRAAAAVIKERGY